MNSRNRKTLAVIFAKHARKNIVWKDIEALFSAIGCRVIERGGSRVAFETPEHRADFHRPRPGKEAKLYQAKAVKEFLETLGVKP
ncbi:MAG: type II toxin-antitoxin system HicA family toxin [Deltaproteobacteria bacterium]|jgi:hypothetical protein|nr:type II toxin-antitoxin system HicA family toxin [Deltaproteobacteria bacterium]